MVVPKERFYVYISVTRGLIFRSLIERLRTYFKFEWFWKVLVKSIHFELTLSKTTQTYSILVDVTVLKPEREGTEQDDY